MNVDDIRRQFAELRARFPEGNASGTLEIIGASFEVTDDVIFGAPAPDWQRRETDWYLSQSLNIGDLEGAVPAAWRASASPELAVLSNYGWAMLSADNHTQYAEVLAELRADVGSRRAVALYARPSMRADARAVGCRDVFCTLGVSYLVRAGRLGAVVHMRSSDCELGFKGDVHWQRLMLGRLASELGVPTGPLVWQASSLHAYARTWPKIDEWSSAHPETAPIDDKAYDRWHYYLRRRLGKASAHACAGNCLNPAADWALRAGLAAGRRAFVEDVSAYEPLCRRCHVERDRPTWPLDAPARERIAASNRGRDKSPETRAKLSAAAKGRSLSPEHKAKISAALLARSRAAQ